MSYRLTELQAKPSLRIAGIMSGTSLDGIDVAIVTLTGNGTSTRVTVEACDTVRYTEAQRAELLALQGTLSLGLVTRMNVALGHLLASAVKTVANAAKIELSAIDLIGSHGQTIHHAPSPEVVLGLPSRGTLQIGDPSVIAQDTGIVTIGDFRVADCAVGGDGAPLIPMVDYILFRTDDRTRVMLNIGGIANVTVLPKGCGIGDVWGFDTGPGNMIIDAICRRAFGESYDRNGTRAASGVVSEELLAALLAIPYFTHVPPKSTGREMFGDSFVEDVVRRAPQARAEDLIATVTMFTSRSIAEACHTFIAPRHAIDEIVVSGGGVHNETLMAHLSALLYPVPCLTTTELGIDADAKEAIGFAVLANETIHERTGNIPSVTNAERPAILGKICLPH